MRRRSRARLRDGLLWLDEKPLVVVLAASGARRREAVARVLGLGFLEYAILSIAALVASALLFFGLDGSASNAVTLPSLVIVPVAGVALWATSPSRVRRLSRPRSGFVRR